MRDTPKHVDRFIDRHGKPRYYFRVGKGPRVRLRGEPGSLEFADAYRGAQLERKNTAEKVAGCGGSSGLRTLEALASARSGDVDG